MIHVGDKIVEPRGIARVTVGERVVFDSATSGGGGITGFVSPNPVAGAVAQISAQTVTTQEATVYAEGGVAPYTYAWVKTAGGPNWTILRPASVTTAFRATGVAAAGDDTATFEVTITDARGHSVTASVDAIASNYGRLSGDAV